MNTRFVAPWEHISSVRITHLPTEGIYVCNWHRKQDWPVLTQLWATKSHTCATLASSVLKSVGNYTGLCLTFGFIRDFVTTVNMSITLHNVSGGICHTSRKRFLV